MLPLAMAGGILFHSVIGYLSPLSPYLIGLMLFFTYCRLNPQEFRINRLSILLIIIQLSGSLTLYLLLRPFNEVLAQAAFICFFCPTATAAPVITGMLGGNITKLAAFSLLSNIIVAIFAPVIFTFIGAHGDSNSLSFLHITGLISLKVIPLILGPLFLAVILQRISPKGHSYISAHQDISFYIWAISLFIVVGNAVSYIINHLTQYPNEGITMLNIAFISMVCCCSQFYIGRKIGNYCGDKIAGAQGLGQKNTVLAIWMSLSFMNPLSSVGPAAYIVWQNTINSIQLWIRNNKSKNAPT